MMPASKNYMGVGLIGLAIVIFWILGMPSWNRISMLKTSILEREGILSSRNDILKKIEDLNKQYQQRSSDVSKISSLVPSLKNSAELVTTIEAVSQQSGLQLGEITMGSSGNQQQELQTVFVELGLKGVYPSLTSFLELIEKNLRLVDVTEISVSQAANPGQQFSLNFRIKANAYYLKLSK